MEWKYGWGSNGNRVAWGQEWTQNSSGCWVAMKMGWAWDSNEYEVKRRWGGNMVTMGIG